MNLYQTRTYTASPSFEPGEKIGQLTITDYLGFMQDHPVTKHHYAKRVHWFEVACDCGEVETLNQEHLRKRTCCRECLSEQRSRTARKLKPAETGDCPDFARMKL